MLVKPSVSPTFLDKFTQFQKGEVKISRGVQKQSPHCVKLLSLLSESSGVKQATYFPQFSDRTGDICRSKHYKTGREGSLFSKWKRQYGRPLVLLATGKLLSLHRLDDPRKTPTTPNRPCPEESASYRRSAPHAALCSDMSLPAARHVSALDLMVHFWAKAILWLKELLKDGSYPWVFRKTDGNRGWPDLMDPSYPGGRDVTESVTDHPSPAHSRVPSPPHTLYSHSGDHVFVPTCGDSSKGVINIGQNCITSDRKIVLVEEKKFKGFICVGDPRHWLEVMMSYGRAPRCRPGYILRSQGAVRELAVRRAADLTYATTSTSAAAIIQSAQLKTANIR
ncbi:hypothetical protein J6590_034031 [Homalodisca vitripennis]|nr:hypothetical protein J6590_034031 [Homalodisca vitripennis]